MIFLTALLFSVMNTPSPSPYFQSAGPTIGHGDISQTHNGHGEIVHSGPEFIAAVIIVIVCLASACFASGLTQGLLSLDAMEVKSETNFSWHEF